MKNGRSKMPPLSEGDIVLRLHRYRARLVEELQAPHWPLDVKDGIRYALKWLDKILTENVEGNKGEK